MATDFGKALKDYRKEKKLSLETMAKMLGTTKQALSRYERGERQPKITVAARFSEILNIPLVDLAGGTDSYTDGEPRKIVVYDSDFFRLLMENMSAENYDLVLKAFSETEQKMREKGII